MPEERIDVVVDCSKDKIRTKQSFKKECDINEIMKRYTKTGVLTESAINKRQASFADVSEIGDFQECTKQVAAASLAFDTLAGHVRRRFNNNPAELLDFCSIEANKEEAIELGIIQKVETAPEAAPATPPAPAEPPTT